MSGFCLCFHICLPQICKDIFVRTKNLCASIVLYIIEFMRTVESMSIGNQSQNLDILSNLEIRRTSKNKAYGP